MVDNNQPMCKTMSPLCFWIAVFMVCTEFGYSNVVVDEIVDVVGAEAVAGAIAFLPCDLSPPIMDDKVHLVIWYKDSIDMPIYSYDARGTAPEKGTHWAAGSSLGERAYFRYKEVPSKLVLQDIREADGGLYRCRVDFRKSPTKNYKVNLTIILPPQKLSVLDDRGAHIQHYILGPYAEGSSVEITCLSTGGRPLPRVTWWQENALLDDSYETLSERRVRNVLHLERLERRHLHTVFTCQAANNNLVAPISSAVTLDLYLDPLWVRLLGQNRPMSADQGYEVSCEVVGARPAPIISWWKGNQPLRNARESVNIDGNVTVSILKLTPTLEDAGNTLSCRATTPPEERKVLQDSWTLNIYHVPIVYLELQSSKNSSVIKEGMDVVMECRIRSNPWVYRISWRHNGRTLFNNASAGTVINNQTLSLQNIIRARAGIYTCMGSNQEGDGESNAIVIDVKFVPVCRPGQQRLVGAARLEEAKITCEVEANPSNVQFTWRFNNSQETTDIPAASFTVDRTRSVASFTPLHDGNFGDLLCWAKNDLGKQREPCVYNIVPAAGRPEPVSNCSIVNQTADTLHVECDPGHDGGLPQLFVMEVLDALDHTLVHNVTSRAPLFLVTDLPSGLELDVVVYAANGKGRSSVFLLHAYTLRSAARRSVISPVMLHMTPIIGILVGAVVTFILVILIVLIVIRLRKPINQDKKKHTSASDQTSSDSIDSLEKNPDIIPHTSEFLEEEDASTFQKSKLSFYFTPAEEERISVNINQHVYSRSDFSDLQMPTAAYLEQAHSPEHLVTRHEPRRVTFQCQAATLPRRLGATPRHLPSRSSTTSDDSVLEVPGSILRLRPESSSGPPLAVTPAQTEGEVRTPTQVTCLTTTHF